VAEGLLSFDRALERLLALARPLPVVPLFETMDDLHHSPGILAAFLDHPLTARSLKSMPKPAQQIMLGYSDSNKDCGILAAQVALHRAQSALKEIQFRHAKRPASTAPNQSVPQRFLEKSTVPFMPLPRPRFARSFFTRVAAWSRLSSMAVSRWWLTLPLPCALSEPRRSFLSCVISSASSGAS
jgi:hypothetical protein